MRSVKTAVTCLCLLPALMACGSNASGASPTGTVTGTFVTVGGPQPEFGTSRPRPNDGTITLTDTATGATIQGTSGTDGRFSIAVPAGTYSVSGRTPHIMGPNGEATCPGRVGASGKNAVTVAAGRTSTVMIECIVP